MNQIWWYFNRSAMAIWPVVPYQPLGVLKSKVRFVNPAGLGKIAEVDTLDLHQNLDTCERKVRAEFEYLRSKHAN